MKYLLFFFCLITTTIGFAQTDTEKLAIDISNADDANTKQLMQFIWKRHSDISMDGEVKMTAITEFSFNETGQLQTKVIDSDSQMKQKMGVRGRIQDNAVKEKSEYVQKALALSIDYTFMTKGQLLDFFSKATITKTGGNIEATGENVLVKGDKLTIVVDTATNLYLKKTFSSLLGEDAIDGEVNYEKFSSGINHGSTTTLNMPAQKMAINAKNQDYSQRVN